MRKTEGWHYISRIYELELNSEVQNSKELVMLSDAKGKDSNAAVIKETEAVEKENPSKETATQKPTTEPATPAYGDNLQYLREREFTQRQQLITAVIFLFLKLGVMAAGKMIIRHLFLQYDAMIQEFGCKYYIVVGDTDDQEHLSGDPQSGETDANGDYIRYR